MNLREPIDVNSVLTVEIKIVSAIRELIVNWQSDKRRDFLFQTQGVRIKVPERRVQKYV
jgi:hypothetical protein